MANHKFLIYNMVMGIIFFLKFGIITVFSCIWIIEAKSSFQVINAVLCMVLGMLGCIDGIKTFSKSLKYFKKS